MRGQDPAQGGRDVCDDDGGNDRGGRRRSGDSKRECGSGSDRTAANAPTELRLREPGPGDTGQ